ncbi:type VI secretion system Vgr family protein, partial [Pseudorhizobium xiangyangii]|uniref:type VI secretion system Vgr family protein n=1 Tax=Pseudorhizobium xiangyangii TaxID=2883104 RepID=UPI0036F44675
IPRIGHEVIVDFLEGDPDQPIVTGRTYHATNKPPYKLPDHKTRTTIKSQTHKGEGFNELRFEDQAGQEEVYVHAQKDLNLVIGNDETRFVKGNVALNVSSSYGASIASHKTQNIGGNNRLDIGGDYVISVGAQFVRKFVEDKLAKAFDGIFKPIKNALVPLQNAGSGNLHTHVLGNKMDLIGISSLEVIAGIKKIAAGHSVDINAGEAITMIAGKQLHDGAGTIRTITALEEIKLQCGKASITMSADGKISLKGTKINLN